MGDDSGYTLVINNQYISYGLDDADFEMYLGFIHDYYKGFSLTPMSFTLAEPDFSLKIGDRITVIDEEENVTVTGNISEITISGDCSMTVTCGGFGNVSGVVNYNKSSVGQNNQTKAEVGTKSENSYITKIDFKKDGFDLTFVNSDGAEMVNKFIKKAEIVFYDIFDFLNIVFIIVYFILNTVTEVFIYPDTAIKRRMGYIDNSIGSKLLDKPLTGYFSNDNIPVGSYKLAVNCYENCFFSYNIAKAMTLKIVIKNSLFFFLFLGCAYFGFQGNILATPIIQIFISTLFLNELIHHLNFRSKLKKILDSFQQLFTHKLKHNDLGTPIYFALYYETALAYNKSPLSDKVYKKINPKLSQEWEELKKRYEIK